MTSKRHDQVAQSSTESAPESETASESSERAVEVEAAGAARPDPQLEAEPAQSPDQRISDLEAQLEEIQAAMREHEDRFLRAKAEVENVRRRAENDVVNARKFAIDQFAAEMLNVRDSLELARAVELKESDHAALQRMQEGLDLTLKQMDSTFSKFAIEVIDPQTGDKLDPQRHQALSIQESAEVPPNHVVAVIQKGYALHERLLRPATVIVAKACEEPEDQPAPGLN